MIAKITNNTIEDPDLTGAPSAALLRGIAHSLGNSGGSAMHGCLTISGNSITGAWPLPIRITTLNTTGILTIPGLSPNTGATAAQVEAYVEPLNGGSNATVSIGGAINNTAGSAPCPLLFAEGGLMEAWYSSSPMSSFFFSTLSTSSRTNDVEHSIIEASSAVSPSLTQQQLNSVVTAAIQRWSATGLTSQQIAALRGVKFEIADLQGAYLGEADGNRIQVDTNAEGKGWFIDPNPLSGASFAHRASTTRLYTDPMNAAAGHVDLLTAIEHEMGHRLGLPDLYSATDRDNLMYGYLTVGERRLPAQGQANGAQPRALKGAHFLSLSPAKESREIWSAVASAARHRFGLATERIQSAAPVGALQRKNHATTRAITPIAPVSGETVTVNGGGGGFTIPAGESITITFQAMVNNPPGARSVSTQGQVSGSNFTTVNTDDPETGTGGDATVTNVNVVITWDGDTSTDWNNGANWNTGVAPVAINDVVIPNVGAQPNVNTTDVTINSLDVANGRTLTIDSGRTLSITGTIASTLVLNGVISGGTLSFGSGIHAISGTGSRSANTTVVSGANVTLNSDMQFGGLTIGSGGSMDITNRTLSLNSNGAALVVVGTLTTTGSTVILNATLAAQTIAGITYNNLTINNAVGTNVTGVTLTGNATVNGVLTLTSSDLDTGAFTLDMPAAATSAEPEGYDFWLNVLNNREPQNFRGMVCSFITSTEYQKRFSSVVTHSNAECGR